VGRVQLSAPTELVDAICPAAMPLESADARAAPCGSSRAYVAYTLRPLALLGYQVRPDHADQRGRAMMCRMLAAFSLLQCW
jgi:hypothetical protein